MAKIRRLTKSSKGKKYFENGRGIEGRENEKENNDKKKSKLEVRNSLLAVIAECL